MHHISEELFMKKYKLLEHETKHKLKTFLIDIKEDLYDCNGLKVFYGDTATFNIILSLLISLHIKIFSFSPLHPSIILILYLLLNLLKISNLLGLILPKNNISVSFLFHGILFIKHDL